MKKGFPFPAEGVYITLHEDDVDKIVVKLPKKNTVSKDADEISINYKVLNLDLSQPEKVRSQYELRVEFTPEQEKKEGVDVLELKYNTMKPDIWEPFDIFEKIHHGENQGGVFVVKTDICDPQVGWFP